MSELRAEIAVVGAGVVGLTTAIELARRGARVRVYARAIDAPPASSAAPAMFTPYAGPAPESFQRWTRTALARLCALAADSQSGVTLGKLREYTYAPRSVEPWLDELLGSNELPTRAPFTSIVDSQRPHIDMLRYLPWLRRELAALGGVAVERSIQCLDELFAAGHTRVVNCSGVGASALAGDLLVRPMHGQVLHVPNDLGLSYSLHDDAPGGLVAYVFRFTDRLVLGGSFEQGREDDQTDEASLAAILERARNLLRADGHPRWNDLGRTILQARAARRPARGVAGIFEDIRLEGEERGADRRVVHNYGHGRMGVSLSWATAVEAADLCLAGREFARR